MNAYFDGQPIFGPRGPAGPDGNPIGTVISYMGMTAPEDYLVCDGSVYDISKYPELARFFEKQFGTTNHFGGDGETTFAVPDLRNLFLRGYRGDAEKQLSGEVGKKQDGTSHPGIYSGKNSAGIENITGLVVDSASTINAVRDYDTNIIGTRYVGVQAGIVDGVTIGASSNMPFSYTSRPVNAAVLYCIKAVTSVPAENVYSTEETRIGTWIDGKPLYRRVIKFTTPTTLNVNTRVYTGFNDVDKAVTVRAVIYPKTTRIELPVPSHTVGSSETFEASFAYIEKGSNGGLFARIGYTGYVGADAIAIIEYTKTTD